MQRIASGRIIKRILAIAEIEQVDIVARAALQPVGTAPAVQNILVGTALQRLVATAAVQFIGFRGASGQRVVVGVTEEDAAFLRYGNRSAERVGEIHRLPDDIRPFPHRTIGEFDRLNGIRVGCVGGRVHSLLDSQRLPAGFDAYDKVHIAGIRLEQKFERITVDAFAKTYDVPLRGTVFIIADHVMAVAEIEQVNVIARTSLHAVGSQAAVQNIIAIAAF